MPITKIKGKTKNGKQGYRVRINYTDTEGMYRREERIVYGMEEAKDLEASLRSSVKNTPVEAVTLDALSKRYFDVKKSEVRESTLHKAKGIYRVHIEPLLGDKKLDNLTVRALEDWKTKINEKNLSIVMRKNIYGDLRAILNYAVKIDMLPKNPLVRVGNFKDAYEKKEELHYYTKEQFIAYIAAAKEDAVSSGDWRYYVFFNILFFTGARKGEANALTWADLSGDTIHINKSVVQKLSGGDRITPPKNKTSDRKIQLPAPLLHVLEEQKQRQQENKTYSPTALICGGTNFLRDTSIELKNKKYAQSAHLPKIRVHDFRHSHASLLANEGINIQEVARRLGHAKIEMTWNTYAHLYPREEERAIKLLDSISIP